MRSVIAITFALSTLASALSAAPVSGEAVYRQRCAACHREIYESYIRTPMALSAGVVTGRLDLETFSRATFRLFGTHHLASITPAASAGRHCLRLSRS